MKGQKRSREQPREARGGGVGGGATSCNSPPTLASNSPPGPRLVVKSDPRKRGVVASLTRAGAPIHL